VEKKNWPIKKSDPLRRLRTSYAVETAMKNTDEKKGRKFLKKIRRKEAEKGNYWDFQYSFRHHLQTTSIWGMMLTTEGEG